MKHLAAALVVCMTLLSACSSSDEASQSVAYHESPVPPGMAQLVLYLPAHKYLIKSVAPDAELKLNGNALCSLPFDHYFVVNIAPGAVDLSGRSSLPLHFSTTHYPISTEANKRYYVRIDWNAAKAAPMTQSLPPYTMQVVDPRYALRDLAGPDMKLHVER